MFKQILLALFAISLIAAPCSYAQAGVITTQEAMSAETRAAAEDHVRTAFAREEVRQAMQQLGVNPADAEARIASLSDAELVQLQGQVDQLPAGGSALAVIGLVFVVLLILEIVGVTNIFNRV